jgi:threonylcarbamoyladenosine tRNA methylthiotransferase MtaB
MKIAFRTLGCKVNQYETQALKENFLNKGYELVDEDDFADVYVINTCTVTGLSDKKSRQFIRRVRKINPEAVTAVIGCYAQISPEEASAIEGVNIIAGTDEKHKLPEYVEDFLTNRSLVNKVKPIETLNVYEETGSITAMDSRTRAYIKIQEGCNKFCAYCIIPYARGAVRSRDLSEIVKEAKSLIDKGFKELVITGINTALYGIDRGQLELEDVISAIQSLPGDFRIRLGSLEPTVINAEFAKRLLQYDKLCPHMHLSLQSGSDGILKDMNRNYSVDYYKKIVDVLRDHDSGYAVTTDIIAGFPGESDVDFLYSINAIREIGFAKVHVFKYSKRKGTKAAEMKNQIVPEIKSQRSSALIKASELATIAFHERNRGHIRTVLVEKVEEGAGWVEGLTENYIKTYINISESEDPQKLLNEFVRVVLVESFRDGMSGRIVE